MIDMHFHMRRTPALNIAHQQGAGVTAANLLTRNDAAAAGAACRRRIRPCFPAGSAPPMSPSRRPSRLLTQAVKSGAKGFGELKYPVAADGPEMRRVYDLAAELDVPVLVHFQEVGQPAAPGGYNTGIKRFAAMLKAYPRTKFIGHADAFWANISADYHEQDAYPTGPIVPGGVSDKLLSDYPNLFADTARQIGQQCAVARSGVHQGLPHAPPGQAAFRQRLQLRGRQGRRRGAEFRPAWRRACAANAWRGRR